MNNPALSMISMCRKAQKLKMGFDSVEKTLQESKLIIFTSDISPKTRDRMLFAAKNKRAPFRDIPETSDDVHFAVGKRVAVLSITDRGLARSVLAKLDAATALLEKSKADTAIVEETTTDTDTVIVEEATTDTDILEKPDITTDIKEEL